MERKKKGEIVGKQTDSSFCTFFAYKLWTYQLTRGRLCCPITLLTFYKQYLQQSADKKIPKNKTFIAATISSGNSCNTSSSRLYGVVDFCLPVLLSNYWNIGHHKILRGNCSSSNSDNNCNYNYQLSGIFKISSQKGSRVK